MATPAPLLAENEIEESSPISLDVALCYIRRFWYLLLLAAAVGTCVAYYMAGRQKYVYSKTASVMLRDAKAGIDNSSDRIMHELGVDASAANMANESCILKSTALMIRTVEALNINVSYWKPEGFRQVSLYKATPLIVEFADNNSELLCELTITPINVKNYRLTFTTSSGEKVHEGGEFGRPLHLPFATVTVHPTTVMQEQCYGHPVVVRRQSVLGRARELLARLTVGRPATDKESSLLQLTLEENNPQVAADVLDKLIEVYNQNSRDAKGEAARRTEAFIRSRLAELGADLNAVDEKIAAQKSKEDVVTSVEAGINADYTTTQAISQEIFQLNTQLKLASTLAQNLTTAEKKADLIALDSGVGDSNITSILQGYNEAYLAYQRVASSAGSRNPVVVDLRNRMRASLTAAKRAVDNYKKNTELKIQELEEKNKVLDNRISKTTELGQALTPLVREHNVKEELYMLLLKKEQENALSLALATPSAVVLETAHGSDAPLSPNTRIYMIAGGGIGGALCLLIILGIDMLNNKVRTRQDLAAKTNLPVLAELPILSRKDRKTAHGKHVLIRDERSQMAECLHILRANAESLVPRQPGKALTYLLTSTMPGEGKTLLSFNLAVTFAKTGRRVLLLDFDFRKRSLSHSSGGKGRKGITSLLLNQVDDVSDVLHHFPGTSDNVDIIYAGPPVPNPVTLLTQPKVKQLLDGAKEYYDIIILDCPPFNALVDTAILAPFCDATLYLLRSGRVSKDYIPQIQRLVDIGKLPPLGFILNAVDFQAASYYYYGYGYGYGYRYGSSKDEEQEIADAVKDAPTAKSRTA